MDKHIEDDAYFLVEADWNKSFLLGIHRKSWHLQEGEKVTGAISFDDKPPVPLNGSVIHPTVMLLSFEQEDFLKVEFKVSKFLKMSFGTEWVQLNLTGSKRAVELLETCAKEVWPGAGDEEEALRHPRIASMPNCAFILSGGAPRLAQRIAS